VGPYREPGEDLEREHDAREIAAFREVLERRGRRVRAGVFLAGLAALLAIPLLFLLGSLCIEPVGGGIRGTGSTHCETHLITPSSGDPIPMTICR
jgi:hypothetical protein